MIRFATIGSGHIVEQFLTEAQKHPDFTLTAVYSRTGERAAEFAAQWGAALTFTDLNQLAACPEVDAVYIASPNLCHAEQAMTEGRQAHPVRKTHGHHLHRLRRHGAAGAQ